MPEEQRVQVGGDDLLERHEALAVGQRDEAGEHVGTFTRAKRRSPVSGSQTIAARLSERFEMYGNGCAGSTASGVSTGKIRCSKNSHQLAVVVRARARPSRPARSPLRRSSGSSRRAAGPPGAARTRSTRSPMAASCCAGVSPSGDGAAMPGRHLVLQRGHAHLEELVEVGREDGAELQPLEQRDAGLGGQRQHALVELRASTAHG